MLTPEAVTVLGTRYLQPGESPADMFWRVARTVAAAEEWYGGDAAAAAERYFDIMSSLTFLPNSPALMNAGRGSGQLAACFVLPVEDSLAGIFETLKLTALIHQSGGGTGFSFSRLRPQGDRVALTGGEASGPVSFIGIFDKATEIVRQGAARRGANMAVLRADHPDIRQFVTAKQHQSALNNFNLSVGITDQFMAAVRDGDRYQLINPRNGAVTEELPARDIFRLLTEMAWANGEPGLFFLDTVNRFNPTPGLGDFEAPNPCSEQPLLPYESCVLGSINLNRVLESKENGWVIDYDRLGQAVDTAVRFLDSVLDVNVYPVQAVKEATLKTRKIGLGIMGLADVFVRMGIPYGAEPAVRLTGRIMNFVTNRARQQSARLAAERGVFPAWPVSVYGQRGEKMRNATVTTIAPTGTISILANCSSGIEPLFALSVSRRALDGVLLRSINQAALQFLGEKQLLSDDVYKLILQNGSVTDSALPLKVKAVLATAHEIPPAWHVRQLSAAQAYTDNGVSKTVNLPHGASAEDVAAIFFQAWESGCKGVTVYRDGSRAGQILMSGLENCPTC